jgi:hypothetical protein
MKLEEIQSLWEEDSQIDRTELGEESLKISRLHNKYFKIFSNERLSLRKLEMDYKSLYKLKYQYYQGILSDEEYKELGWEPFQLKVLKQDIPVYIEGDADIININLRIGLQSEKVSFVESIIKSLANRGYQIKNVIEWERFKIGG